MKKSFSMTSASGIFNPKLSQDINFFFWKTHKPTATINNQHGNINLSKPSKEFNSAEKTEMIHTTLQIVKV